MLGCPLLRLRLGKEVDEVSVFLRCGTHRTLAISDVFCSDTINSLLDEWKWIVHVQNDEPKPDKVFLFCLFLLLTEVVPVKADGEDWRFRATYDVLGNAADKVSFEASPSTCSHNHEVNICFVDVLDNLS